MRVDLQWRGLAVRRRLKVCVCLGAALILAHAAARAGETDEPADVPYREDQRWLNDDALAVRLAAFLWRAPPDPELRELAGRRELHRPEVLRAQTHRLLRDAKSRRFVEAFLASWLEVRVARANGADAPARCAPPSIKAVEETQSHFAMIVREQAGLDALVTSKCTLLNQRLAARYGESALAETRRRPERLAHDLVHELAAFATGTRLRVSDTSAVADILARSKPDGYAVATLIHEVVQSEFFQSQ